MSLKTIKDMWEDLKGQNWLPTSENAACVVCKRHKFRRYNESSYREGDPVSFSDVLIPLKKLQRSARSGCPGCRLLNNAICTLGSSSLQNTKDPLHVLLQSKRRGRPIFMEVYNGRYPHYMRPYNPKEVFEHFILYHRAGYSGIRPFGPLAMKPTSIPISSRADKVFETLQEWLSQCVKSHPECKQELYTPKRLLNVLPNGDGEERDMLRINDKDDFIVSHCWGKRPTMTTTESTYYERTKGISVAALPLTFRDAVHITRRIGVQYLWIDSLCIIQGDEVDWAQQSSEMAKIYANSYVTIAASTSEDCHGGILGDRSPFDYEVEENSKVTPTSCSIHAQNQVLKTLEQDHHKRFDTLSGGLVDPLAKRAWAFQERFLSARIIHYTAYEMVMECKSGRRCECEHFKTTHSNGSLIRSYLGQGVSSAECVDVLSYWGLPTPGVRLIKWDQIVTRYTALQLSHQTDILPAISGLAKEFKLQEQLLRRQKLGIYCAGLWLEHFPHNLLWYGRHQSSKPRPYSGPSWSWASVTGEVHWLAKEPVQKDFQILDINCIPSTHDRFGQVSKGSITLRGYLNRWPTQPQAFKIWYPEELILLRKRTSHPLWIYLDDIGPPYEPNHLFLLEIQHQIPQHMGTWKEHDNIPHPEPFLHGLVLLHIEDEVYERVGVFSAIWDSDIPNEYDDPEGAYWYKSEYSQANRQLQEIFGYNYLQGGFEQVVRDPARSKLNEITII